MFFKYKHEVSLIFKIDVGARKLKGHVATLDDADIVIGEAQETGMLYEYTLSEKRVLKSSKDRG